MSSKQKARLKPSHAADAAAHCTNHYTRSVTLLEGVVEERLAQLTLLTQDNAALKRREAALQSAIGSLAGSVSAATRAVLASSSGGGGPAGTHQEPPHAESRVRPDSPDMSASESLIQFTSSITDGKGFLLSMQQRELAVQRIMQQLGGSDYEDLYSSWLLRRAFSNSSRAASYLSMPLSARVAFVLATVQKLGLLVGKYDLLHHPCTSMGTPREQVDRLVDDLNERTLAFCLLAPPHRQLEMACLNMETGEPEPYPLGWWAVVIDAMQLTGDQKSALKICWDKVKPVKLALTAQHERLSARLAELQRRQLDSQRQFQLQAQHMMDAAIGPKGARFAPGQLPAKVAHAQVQEALQQQDQQQQQQQPQPAQPQQLLPQPLERAQGVQQQQPQPQPQPQPALQQQQAVGPLMDSEHEQDLLDFCRALLGREVTLHGDCDMPKTSAAAAAAAAKPAAGGGAGPSQASGQPPQQGLVGGSQATADAAAAAFGRNGATPPATGCGGGALPQQQQQQLSSLAVPGMQGYTPQPYGPGQACQHQPQPSYAARMLPPQLPSAGAPQFSQFSPCVAAAAVDVDQGMWLHGVLPQCGDAPALPSGALCMPLSAPGSGGGGGKGCWGDGMMVDGGDGAADGGGGGCGDACAFRPHAAACSGALNSCSASLQEQTASGTTSSPSGDSVAARVVAAGLQALPPLQQQEAVRSMLSCTDAHSQRELLLQVASKEQQQLEQQLDRITALLKLQQYCMHTYVLNICSKKQMALKYIFCFPWFPESLSMCEALDEFGW